MSSAAVIGSGFQKSTIKGHEVGFMKFMMIEHIQLHRKVLDTLWLWVADDGL